MSDTPQAIEFTADVRQVKTLVDQGIVVALNLPESAIMQAAMLMECKRMGVALQIKAIVAPSKTDTSEPDLPNMNYLEP